MFNKQPYHEISMCAQQPYHCGWGTMAILEAAVVNGVCQEVIINNEYESDDNVKEMMSILKERKSENVGNIITLIITIIT